MKKIVVIFAAMAAVLSSCQKNELESVSANDCKDIVLNISVSNPGAGDTKALVKTGWVKDDQIKIWFDDHTGDTPDLVIKYDGSWKGTPASAPTKQEGNIKAVYNNFVIVASKDKYTYTDNTLSFHIDNWKFLTEIQVVVKGIPYYYDATYKLSCDKFTPVTRAGFTVGPNDITAATAATKGGAVKGISNADGVAFVFATADYSSSNTDKKEFTFTLTDDITGSEVTKVYKPEVVIEAKPNKSSIKALTIDISKFAVPAPEYVTIGGLNWATKNLGATTVNDFGLLYSWGNITGQTGYNDNPPFVLSQYKLTEGYKIDGINVLWNKETHDAAYVATGGKWRMPTKSEFDALNSACKVNDNNLTISSEYIENGKVKKGRYWLAANQTVLSGINELKDITAAGILFSDGENYVFFPIAGTASTEGTSRASTDSGYYWSSTYKNSDDAHQLNFYKTGLYVTSSKRWIGCSIRPVADVN